MAVKQTEEIIIPSSPEDLKAIADVMKDLSRSLTRCDGEKDYRKEALKGLEEKFGIKAKHFRRMMNEYHKDQHKSNSEERTEFDELYGAVLGE